MSTTDEQLVAGDVPLWEVPGWRERFGVAAGITGRGDAAAPFDLGLWTSNPVGEVMGRWRRFLASFPEHPCASLAHQVHGASVLWHEGAGERGLTLAEGADGHATSQAGRLLLVTVADCIPVYLFAPERRAIALLHAGWRGTAGGILAAGVRMLSERARVAPRDIVMHCGVGISGPSYQVGREVMDGVAEPATGAGPWHLDLRGVLARQAVALGVAEVTLSRHCSARDRDNFFSHRASGGSDGRMVGYLGIGE